MLIINYIMSIMSIIIDNYVNYYVNYKNSAYMWQRQLIVSQRHVFLLRSAVMAGKLDHVTRWTNVIDVLACLAYMIIPFPGDLGGQKSKMTTSQDWGRLYPYVTTWKRPT